MNTKLLLPRFLLPITAALIASCSGGNVDVSFKGPDIDIPPFPDTNEAITTRGVITDLGDLTVNNVRYDADRAMITINGEPGTLADLELGQIVTVTGRIALWSGTANAIRYDARLIGPVQSLDPNGDRLTIMGQRVLTDPDTVFGPGIDPATYAGLEAGTVAQISGFADAAGAIHATRIEGAAANAEQRLIGKVEGLDRATLSFRINLLTVDYGSAILIDVPGGEPANGMLVQAIGTMSGTRFDVERLVAAPDLDGRNGERVQIAGLITRFNSASDFEVAGAAARANSGTAYWNGDRNDLALNARVLLDGDFASGGRITAKRITFGHQWSETATLAYTFSDFDEISVPTVFNVSVAQGDEYSVEVAVDADAANRVELTQTGSKLNITLLAGDDNIQTLEAFVTMPALRRIDLTGVANAMLSDFTQMTMAVHVGGVSRLRGDNLNIDNLTGSVSGVSLLDFADIRPLHSADIDISGVSQATLNMDVGATLTGSVATGQPTGTSTLFYYGTDVLVNVSTDVKSSVVRLGDTRP